MELPKTMNYRPSISYRKNKKICAGILAIVIGSLGIHKFILGYTQEGIIQIVISFVTCSIGGVVPLIEGIIYLTKTDEKFYQTYQLGKRVGSRTKSRCLRLKIALRPKFYR
ncbi:TM2 domain-containing protein [Aequorivita sp. KMM 9714]|uniref:TM2 domain-containing protein n=1 Tax=Aequorivita sp. KMM 9714 TaxID=2707173 RepID=UPI0013EDE826|nr:TM2 domain-containing protein [Aequorivita sp. KMM 9714]NGX83083.1 TM2 domain-containing protein [Aequorivita sp. KMM 9714]